MCRRRGCHHLPVSDVGTPYVADGAGNLRMVRPTVDECADTDAGSTVGVKDRGKSYRRQVMETVWVAAVFAGGIILGAFMAGAK